MAECCTTTSATSAEAGPAAAAVHAVVAGAPPVASAKGEEDADAEAPEVDAGLPPPCPANWDTPHFTATHVNEGATPAEAGPVDAGFCLPMPRDARERRRN